MNKEKHIVILRESIIASVTKDLVTFGCIAGLLWFNHSILAGHIFIDVMFILTVLLSVSARKSSRVFEGSPKDSIEWLEGIR